MKKNSLLKGSRLAPHVVLTVAILLIAVRVGAATGSENSLRIGVVADSYVPVRSAPTLVTANVAQLFQGERVNLTGYRTSDSRWVQVKLLGIDGGWVPADSLRLRFPVSDLAVVDYADHVDEQAIGGVAIVTVDLLPVLERLGTPRHILSQLARGEQVTLTGYRAAEGEWIQVLLRDNRLGWVDANAIESDFPLSALSEIHAAVPD